MKRALAALLACLLLSGCVVLPPGPEETLPKDTSPESSPENTAQSDLTQHSTLQEPKDDDLVRIADWIPGIAEDLKYATSDNFTGRTVYDFTDAYARYGTVKKLLKAAQALEVLGYGLTVWDAYRPLAAQRKLWEICPDPTYVSHPETGGRSHCRGSAIDLTLYRLDTGEAVEMPTGFDDFTALADRDYSDCTAEAAKNAKLLEAVMIAAGFKPYAAEWWHYSDETEYPVEESSTP